MPLPPPARVDLARLGTPLQHLPRTSEALGVELWMKRDDLTGAELTGNKVRKLEYLMAEALAEGADTVITCGGEQSNHARATALAAARLGLRARLVLRTDDPDHPPAPTGNILLDRLAGAELRWISRPAWSDRAALMAAEAAAVRAGGGRPYVIPEGGSNALGSWGYVGCAAELAVDLAALPARSTTIVYACGSGGTGAGLIVGAELHGLAAGGVRVAGVNVCDDRAYFEAAIGRIVADMHARWAVPTTGPIELVDGHVGLGYARSRPEELVTIRDLCRRDGVVLDPVYTGKAFHGVVTELARDRHRFGQRIVFVHTGGVFGLFPAAEQLAPLL
ncbi:MAG: D-cysteine desulfhydrase family protein [Kofleriaceae bacterium]|jgi:D-cysteine desulfhydrase|nr:D-cysteine desulfhydrase family protein [Kofleriaceae bacterium]MBP6839096.1 D-cysteine desulfhydrase family protein [Kofleriaceae bacterium]MBP9204898.1 D-cysteine desulfhydrase family protein [Kofleriaceae bacterium]